MEKKGLSTDQMVQMNIKVPLAIRDELDGICDSNTHLNRSKLVRYAIDRYLNQSKQTNDYGLSELFKVGEGTQEVPKEEEQERS